MPGIECLQGSILTKFIVQIRIKKVSLSVNFIARRPFPHFESIYNDEFIHLIDDSGHSKFFLCICFIIFVITR